MPDSMDSIPKVAPKPGGAKGLIIAIVVIVALAAGAYFIFGSGGFKLDSSNSQPVAPINQTGETPATPQIPNEVYSYVGEVTDVGNGQITVLAKKELNLLAADATLTVMADANTQVIRRTIPRVLPEDGGTDLFKQENISVSDIEVGNQVTVVSSTNIRGQMNFTASRIEVLNVQ